MSSKRVSRSAARATVARAFRQPLVRYLFAIAVVLGVFELRLRLIPLTGTGAPFVIFFAAVLVTSLFAGVGPGMLAVALSIPLAAHMFVVRAGYPIPQAIFQSLLFAIDGAIVVYLTSVVNKARRTLQASNDRIRNVVELAPDGFLLADVDGRIVHANQAACELLGFAGADLVGKSMFDLFAADDALRLREVRDELLQARRNHRGEWRLRRKDGTWVPVEISTKILADGRWQAFVRDISERKKAERVQQRLATIVQDSNDAIMVQDLEGNILAWNRSAERMYGYSEREALGMNVRALAPEQDWEAADYLDAIKRGEEPGSLEVKRRAKDGRILDVWLTTTPLIEDHHPVAIATTGRDITRRKRVEEKLRVSQERYRTLFQSIDEGYCVVEVLFDETNGPVDYRFLEVNASFERQTGICNAVGRRMREIAPAHEEHWFRIYGQVALTGEPRRFQNPAAALGRYYDVYAFRIGTPEERQVAILFNDITEQRRLEEQLRRAVRARESVLGIVAHDLRNPLSTILMQATALTGSAAGAEGPRRPQEIISRAAKRMNHLIQDLLDAAQLDEGRELRVKRERVSAKEIVVEALETQQALASSAQLDLHLEIGRDVSELWGDRDRLLQVFENLLGNAVKFTAPGGQITVGAANREGDVLFWVRDSGRGIAADNLPHVFDRFWQAADHGRSGAGLGLSITKGIVEAHGGHIWVESVPGQGSTFLFAIPSPPAAEDHASRAMH